MKSVDANFIQYREQSHDKDAYKVINMNVRSSMPKKAT